MAGALMPLLTRVDDGREVWTWPARLLPAYCDSIIAEMPWEQASDGGEILERQDIVDKLVRDGLLPSDGPTFLQPMPYLTLADLGRMRRQDRGVFLWHKDMPRGARWKVIAYLDEAPGTVFGRESLYTPPTPRGTVVVFDIRIEHCSAPIEPGQRKRTVGIRVA